MRIYVSGITPRTSRTSRAANARENAFLVKSENSFSEADIEAIGLALDEANAAAEKVIASMDKLHITMQDCCRELRLTRQIVEQSNQMARLAHGDARETTV